MTQERISQLGLSWLFSVVIFGFFFENWINHKLLKLEAVNLNYEDLQCYIKDEILTIKESTLCASKFLCNIISPKATLYS